jgi:hypothetical protein
MEPKSARQTRKRRGVGGRLLRPEAQLNEHVRVQNVWSPSKVQVAVQLCFQHLAEVHEDGSESKEEILMKTRGTSANC